MIKKTIENKYFLKFVKLATYLLFIVFMILILLYQIFYHFKLKKHFKKYYTSDITIKTILTTLKSIVTLKPIYLGDDFLLVATRDISVAILDDDGNIDKTIKFKRGCKLTCDINNYCLVYVELEVETDEYECGLISHSDLLYLVPDDKYIEFLHNERSEKLKYLTR